MLLLRQYVLQIFKLQCFHSGLGTLIPFDIRSFLLTSMIPRDKIRNLLPSGL